MLSLRFSTDEVQLTPCEDRNIHPPLCVGVQQIRGARVVNGLGSGEKMALTLMERHVCERIDQRLFNHLRLVSWADMNGISHTHTHTQWHCVFTVFYTLSWHRDVNRLSVYKGDINSCWWWGCINNSLMDPPPDTPALNLLHRHTGTLRVFMDTVLINERFTSASPVNDVHACCFLIHYTPAVEFLTRWGAEEFSAMSLFRKTKKGDKQLLW